MKNNETYSFVAEIKYEVEYSPALNKNILIKLQNRQISNCITRIMYLVHWTTQTELTRDENTNIVRLSKGAHKTNGLSNND